MIQVEIDRAGNHSVHLFLTPPLVYLDHWALLAFSSDSARLRIVLLGHRRTGARRDAVAWRSSQGYAVEWRYSCRRASMGWMMAALKAGMMPKKMPTPALKPKARPTDQSGTWTSTIDGCMEAR